MMAIKLKLSTEEVIMKVAVIGSRSISRVKLEDYLPSDTDEIVSGGARGVDTCAREYALSHGLKLTEFEPDYTRYGRAAPLRRNDLIVEYADAVLAFWDGRSTGTQYVVRKCRETGTPVRVFKLTE